MGGAGGSANEIFERAVGLKGGMFHEEVVEQQGRGGVTCCKEHKVQLN